MQEILMLREVNQDVDIDCMVRLGLDVRTVI